MNKSVNILVSVNKKDPGVYRDNAPTGKLDRLFSFKEKTVPLTDNNLAFINKLNEKLHNDLNGVVGVERYYFDLGHGIIEILITFNDDKTITIQPFIFYNEEEIRVEIQKVMGREFKLYCLFKKWELQ